jgi:DNA-directed RNA polymerase subunit beta
MEKANRDLSSKKQPAEFEAHCEYLSAWEEDKWTIAQANVELDEKGHIVPELANRAAGGQLRAQASGRDRIYRRQPEQLVSVAASLIPFLETMTPTAP